MKPRVRPIGSRARYSYTLGFPARRPWLRPFVVMVFRVEYINGGAWQ